MKGHVQYQEIPKKFPSSWWSTKQSCFLKAPGKVENSKQTRTSLQCLGYFSRAFYQLNKLPKPKNYLSPRTRNRTCSFIFKCKETKQSCLCKTVAKDLSDIQNCVGDRCSTWAVHLTWQGYPCSCHQIYATHTHRCGHIGEVCQSITQPQSFSYLTTINVIAKAWLIKVWKKDTPHLQFCSFLIIPFL